MNSSTQSLSSLSIKENSNSYLSIEKRVNSRGYEARFEKSGKYYCGKNLDGSKCNCCDSYCGLNAGCNCSSCMKLDLSSRNLPIKWLLNSDGFQCRKGSTNLFNCGPIIIKNQYCSPINGSNCDSCKRLDFMVMVVMLFCFNYYPLLKLKVY